MVGECRMKRIFSKDATNEDMKRNLNNVEQNKPLDMTLRSLTNKFKKLYFKGEKRCQKKQKFSEKKNK